MSFQYNLDAGQPDSPQVHFLSWRTVEARTKLYRAPFLDHTWAINLHVNVWTKIKSPQILSTGPKKIVVQLESNTQPPNVSVQLKQIANVLVHILQTGCCKWYVADMPVWAKFKQLLE